jgi:hypothetical protein
VRPPIKRGDPLPVDLDLTVPLIPLYDAPNQHTEPQDDYTLHGYQWEAPYPVVVDDTLFIKYGADALLTFQADLLNLVMTSVPAIVSASTQPAMALLMDQANGVRGLADVSFSGLWKLDAYQVSAMLLNEGTVDIADTPLVAAGASSLAATPISGAPPTSTTTSTAPRRGSSC